MLERVTAICKRVCYANSEKKRKEKVSDCIKMSDNADAPEGM